MNCLRCEIKIVPDANFCHTCGQRLYRVWASLDSGSRNQDVNAVAEERGIALGRDAKRNMMLTGDTNKVFSGDGVAGNKISISGEQDFRCCPLTALKKELNKSTENPIKKVS